MRTGPNFIPVQQGFDLPAEEVVEFEGKRRLRLAALLLRRHSGKARAGAEYGPDGGKKIGGLRRKKVLRRSQRFPHIGRLTISRSSGKGAPT